MDRGDEWRTASRTVPSIRTVQQRPVHSKLNPKSPVCSLRPLWFFTIANLCCLEKKQNNNTGNALIQYWTTLSWLNAFVPRHTTRWPGWLRQEILQHLQDMIKKRAKQINIFFTPHLKARCKMFCADVTLPLPSRSRFITREAQSHPDLIYLSTGKRLVWFIIGQDDVSIYPGRGQTLVA